MSQIKDLNENIEDVDDTDPNLTQVVETTLLQFLKQLLKLRKADFYWGSFEGGSIRWMAKNKILKITVKYGEECWIKYWCTRDYRMSGLCLIQQDECETYRARIENDICEVAYDGSLMIITSIINSKAVRKKNRKESAGKIINEIRQYANKPEIFLLIN